MRRLDLFIAYAKEDETQVRAIQQKATAKGLQAWCAVLLKAPDEWKPRIRQAIIDCEVLCVLFSPHSQGKEWVISEWGAGWVLARIIHQVWGWP